MLGNVQGERGLRPHQDVRLRFCLVDVDRERLRLLDEFLRDQGFEVDALDLRAIRADDRQWSSYSVMIMPLEADGSAGPAAENPALQLLEGLRRHNPTIQVIFLTAKEADLSTCILAVRRGAAGFVESTPGTIPVGLLDQIKQALDRRAKMIDDQQQMHAKAILDETGIVAQSGAMMKLLFQAKRAAMVSDAPVLLYGESGTGKQLLAEAIHKMDPKRKNKPFVSVNCAAITGTLADSALFGHRKGAFTDAAEARDGYFRAANGGTVLLDEISELAPALQPKLLRLLQEGMVLPLGADREEPVDVRVIAASNRPIREMVERHEFRLDLYQRLNVISLVVPPLRERKEDIPPLVQHFLKRYASYYAQPVRYVDRRVYDVLARNIGDGNVRELENLIRRLLAFKQSGSTLELSDLPESLLAGPEEATPREDATQGLSDTVEQLLHDGDKSLPQMMDQYEEMILEAALAKTDTTHTELADRLGITRRTFYNKLQKYGMGNTTS